MARRRTLMVSETGLVKGETYTLNQFIDYEADHGRNWRVVKEEAPAATGSHVGRFRAVTLERS